MLKAKRQAEQKEKEANATDSATTACDTNLGAADVQPKDSAEGDKGQNVLYNPKR